MARCGSSARPTSYVEGVRLRIMQPNLPQDEKFNYAQKQQVMSRYLALSDRATGPQSSGVRDVTHLIWPESAFPFFLTREADVLAQIAALLPEGTVLITGAIRAPEQATPNAPIIRAYNSIYVIDHAGSILSIYDKVHLVPFGEYLPFQALLERLGLMQLTKSAGRLHRRRSPPSGERAGGAELPSARLLRDRLSQCARCRGRTAGLDAQPHQRRLVRRQRRDPISTSSRRACARSRKDCRWSARRIPGFRPWSTRSVASSNRFRSGPRESSIPHCRSQSHPPSTPVPAICRPR